MNKLLSSLWKKVVFSIFFHHHLYKVLLPLPVHNVHRVKMAVIVAASSFFHSLEDLEREERNETEQKVYTVRGLF